MQTLTLDSDSNLFVAGNAHVTKVVTSGVTASGTTFVATLAAASADIALITATPTTLDLVANLGTACNADAADGCCTDGNFDAGIVITRDVVADGASFKPTSTNTVYVANTCATGLVRAIAKAALDACGVVPTKFPCCRTVAFRVRL